MHEPCAKEGLRGMLEELPTSKARQHLPSLPSCSDLLQGGLFLTPAQPPVARTQNI